MQALKNGSIKLSSLPAWYLDSGRPISFLASLSAFPAIHRGESDARSFQGSEVKLLARPEQESALACSNNLKTVSSYQHKRQLVCCISCLSIMPSCLADGAGT